MSDQSRDDDNFENWGQESDEAQFEHQESGEFDPFAGEEAEGEAEGVAAEGADGFEGEAADDREAAPYDDAWGATEEAAEPVASEESPAWSGPAGFDGSEAPSEFDGGATVEAGEYEASAEGEGWETAPGDPEAESAEWAGAESETGAAAETGETSEFGSGDVLDDDDGVGSVEGDAGQSIAGIKFGPSEMAGAALAGAAAGAAAGSTSASGGAAAGPELQPGLKTDFVPEGQSRDSNREKKYRRKALAGFAGVAVGSLLLGSALAGGPTYYWMSNLLTGATQRGDSLEQDLTQTNTQLTAVQSERDTFKNDLSSREAELAVAMSDLDDVNQQLKTEQEAKDAKIAELDQANKDLADARKKQQDTEASLTTAQKQKDDALKMLSETSTELTTAKTQIVKAEEMYAKAAADLKTLQDEHRLATEQLAKAQERVNQLNAIVESGAGRGGDLSAAIALAESTLPELDGGEKAKKQVVLAAFQITQAVRLENGENEAAATRELLQSAAANAEAALQVAQDADDPQLILDASYAKARALEEAGKLEEARDAYEAGAKAAADSGDASRFTAGVFRVRRLLRSRPAPAPGDSSLRLPPIRETLQLAQLLAATVLRSPAPLMAFQAEEARPQNPPPATPPLDREALLADLKQLEDAFDEASVGAPDLLLEIATTLHELGKAATGVERRSFFLQSMEKIDQAARLLKDPARKYDDRDGKLPEELAELRIQVKDDLVAVPESDVIAGLRRDLQQTQAQLAERTRERDKFQQAEQAWFARGAELATLLELRDKLEADQQQRWDSQRAATLASLQQLVDLARQTTEDRRRMQDADAAWARAAEQNAADLGFKQPLPPAEVRWTTARQQTLAWLSGWQAALRTHLEESRRYRTAEEDWAGLAQQIARAVQYNQPLAENPDRWTSARSDTVEWMRAVAGTVQQKADLVDARDGRQLDHQQRLSEILFNEGIERFYRGRYEDALERFDGAVELHDQDARYHYYRGLSKKLSGNEELLATVDRDMYRAAALEADEFPSSQAVSHALNRIQGRLRVWAETYRPAAR